MSESRYLKLFPNEPKETRVYPMPYEPDPDTDGIEWKLRYSPESMTRADQLYAASIVSAYGYLICEMTAKERQSVVSEIRRCMSEVHGDV